MYFFSETLTCIKHKQISTYIGLFMFSFVFFYIFYFNIMIIYLFFTWCIFFAFCVLIMKRCKNTVRFLILYIWTVTVAPVGAIQQQIQKIYKNYTRKIRFLKKTALFLWGSVYLCMSVYLMHFFTFLYEYSNYSV